MQSASRNSFITGVMKARNSSASRPVVTSLVAGLLCCVPTSSRPAQTVSGVTGDSTSLQEQASAVSGFVADSVVSVANATRCLLWSAHKMRRRRRRSRQPSHAGSRQEFLPQRPSDGRAWRECPRLPGCGDHYPRPFRIVPRYRITSFRPVIKVEKSAERNTLWSLRGSVRVNGRILTLPLRTPA